MALGYHTILECYECDEGLLKDQNILEQYLVAAAIDARATVLHTYFHKFDRGEGVTGVIALSESHISVHTWPEYGYMAIDIFMCGDSNPIDAADFIINNLRIGRFSIDTINRGDDFK